MPLTMSELALLLEGSELALRVRLSPEPYRPMSTARTPDALTSMSYPYTAVGVMTVRAHRVVCMSRLAIDWRIAEITSQGMSTLLERHNRVLSKKHAAVLRELERTRAELAAARGNAFKGQLRLGGPGAAAREADEADVRHQLGAARRRRAGRRGRRGRGQEQGRERKETKEAARPRPQGAAEAAGRRGEARARRGGQGVPQVRRRSPGDGGPVRGARRRSTSSRCASCASGTSGRSTRCHCGGHIETALGPDKLCPGARYSVNFAIYVAISKYCDHLPLERQVRMMAREGLDGDEPDAVGPDRAARVAGRVGDAAAARLHAGPPRRRR